MIFIITMLIVCAQSGPASATNQVFVGQGQRSGKDPGAAPERKWVPETISGIPLWIAFDSDPGEESNFRAVFLFIEPENFTEENLTKVFRGLEAKSLRFGVIRIDVYSDKELLKRGIAIYTHTALPGEEPPELGDPPEKILEWLYGSKRDSARARYYRSTEENTEGFYYRPDPESLEMVEVVLKAKAAPRYGGNIHSDFLLAAALGDTARVEALIESGAELETRNDNGETALLVAVSQNRADAARVLLQHGAFVDARNKYGQTALVEGVTIGNVQLVRLLLDHGADPDARYGHDITPLIHAAYNGKTEVVDLLLKRGADPNRQDDEGNCALLHAVERRSIEIVELLLARGADVNLTNRWGRSAMTSAEKLGDMAVIRLLRTARDR